MAAFPSVSVSGLHRQCLPVAEKQYIAGFVGPVDFCASRFKPLQRFRVGVAVFIVPAAADDGVLRGNGVEESLR